MSQLCTAQAQVSPSAHRQALWKGSAGLQFSILCRVAPSGFREGLVSTCADLGTSRCGDFYRELQSSLFFSNSDFLKLWQ